MKKLIFSVLLSLSISYAEQYRPPKLRLKVNKAKDISPKEADTQSHFRVQTLQSNPRELASQKEETKLKRDPSSVEDQEPKKFLPYKVKPISTFSP